MWLYMSVSYSLQLEDDDQIYAVKDRTQNVDSQEPEESNERVKKVEEAFATESVDPEKAAEDKMTMKAKYMCLGEFMIKFHHEHWDLFLFTWEKMFSCRYT